MLSQAPGQSWGVEFQGEGRLGVGPNVGGWAGRGLWVSSLGHLLVPGQAGLSCLSVWGCPWWQEGAGTPTDQV
jgi:hypothetical protein